MITPMISPAQCRAARALLGMDQGTLAEAACVSRSVIIDFESGSRKTIKRNLDAITQVLKQAGVEFTPDNNGVGLRLKTEAITPAQCRVARGLLDMGQASLARAANISKSALVGFENDSRTPDEDALAAIIRVLEDAGVAFIPANGGGPGLRLKK